MQSTSFLDATLFADLELIMKSSLLIAWLDEDVVEDGQAERDRASGLPFRLVISESSIGYHQFAQGFADYMTLTQLLKMHSAAM